MNVYEALEGLKKEALRDAKLREALLATKQAVDPLSAFCAISTDRGYPITPMELVVCGEESYAQIRRSTNGGGENSPLLEWSDDYYELFLADIS